MPSPWKLIGLTLIAIVLGLATSVAIALACARWSPVEQTGRPYGTGLTARRSISTADGFGVERIEYELGGRTLGLRMRPPHEAPELPSWIDPPDEDDQFVTSMKWIGAGWPAICLRTHSRFDMMDVDPNRKQWKSGYVIERGFVTERFSARVLPLDPVPSGLAINGAAWTGAWLVPLLGVAIGRRGMRRVRGRCPACGYDLRGSTGDVCPECGRSNPRANHPAVTEAKSE